METECLFSETIHELEAETCPVMLGIPDDDGAEHQQGDHSGEVGMRRSQMPTPGAASQHSDCCPRTEKHRGVLAEQPRSQPDTPQIPTPTAAPLQRDAGADH